MLFDPNSPNLSYIQKLMRARAITDAAQSNNVPLFNRLTRSMTPIARRRYWIEAHTPAPRA